MRILITNDDGINAPGLAALQTIAAAIAGPQGEVWTVAPAFEQSGVAHAISYVHPTMIAQLGERRFAAEGSPADCVLAGLHDVMKGAWPDLVLSGVNRGNNSGENAVYSGTVGGAMEAALHGIPAIALSQFYGPGNSTLPDPFEAALIHGPATVRSILDHGQDHAQGHGQDNGHGIDDRRGQDRRPYRIFYNVNFPPLPASQVRGLRVTPQGFRSTAQFGIEAQTSPSGRRFLWVTGGPQAVRAGAGSDVDANLDGYISVTPMRADLTAHDALGPLAARLDSDGPPRP